MTKGHTAGQGRVWRASARVGAGLALSVALTLWSHGALAGCADAPEACEIGGGSYHIALPAADLTPRDGAPALMFLHGWGSSGQATMNMRGVVQSALDRGYAVIAPDGVPRPGRNGLSWGFHPDRPGPRDEIAFLKAVRDDAAVRHGIDTSRVVLGGFSIGGSMTSYLACTTPDTFAAYAPVAGAFWVPHPVACAGPVDLFHTHGWTDGVVPLEGRILGGAEGGSGALFAQADVWQAMQVWRAANGCPPDASSHAQSGIFLQRSWRDCASGRRLDFALFNGGHVVPEGWSDMALDWFEGR